MAASGGKPIKATPFAEVAVLHQSGRGVAKKCARKQEGVLSTHNSAELGTNAVQHQRRSRVLDSGYSVDSTLRRGALHIQATMLDTLIIAADNALRTLSGSSSAARPMPTFALDEESDAASVLGEADKARSGALMRVNHVGEICAQALYQAQAMSTRDPLLRRHFEHAAREETDHLAWTRQRLDELGARPSFLNPVWYAGAFAVGLLAGRAGDANSLGFVVETERQVERHLDGHLDALPAADSRSRAVVQQMKEDEARHARQAEESGATRLPLPVRWAMQGVAKVMTTTARFV